MTISAWGSLFLAAGLALCGVGRRRCSLERRGELMHYNDVQIEVVIDGNGPAVVLLPSLARTPTITTRSQKGWRRPAFASYGRSRAASAAAPDP